MSKLKYANYYILTNYFALRITANTFFFRSQILTKRFFVKQTIAKVDLYKDT